MTGPIVFLSDLGLRDEFVGVPFPLPHTIPGNEGFPLLPAAKAADWYRSSFRLMLNTYYGTHFDPAGPVFRSNDDTAGPSRRLALAMKRAGR